MIDLSNTQGRAYEYITLITLYTAIQNIRPAQIIENSSLYAAQRAFETLSRTEKSIYKNIQIVGMPTSIITINCKWS